MAADAWVAYDQFMLEKSNGTQDLDNDTFSVILMTSTYTPNTATDTTYAGINANEVANGNGYATGGVTRTQTLTKTAGNINFTLTNPAWTASGGNIVARYAVIRNNTSGGLVAYSLLDNTPDDITVVDGNTFTIDIATNTVYDETRA
jgi:hypothetical protein